MLVKYTTSLLIDGHSKIDCPPITHDNSIGLAKDGLVSIDKADIVLKIDSHDELVAIKTNQKQVKLERYGRSMLLKPERPVRVFEKDCLYIDDTTICISKSTYLTVKPTRVSKYFQKTKRFLASSSIALCSFVAINACDLYEDEANAGSAPADECYGDEMKCDNNAVYKCENYEWVKVEDCGNESCQESDGAAYCVAERTAGEAPLNECENGKKKCQDNFVFECKDYQWTEVEQCDEDNPCVENNGIALCFTQRATAGSPPDDDPDIIIN